MRYILYIVFCFGALTIQCMSAQAQGELPTQKPSSNIAKVHYNVMVNRLFDEMPQSFNFAFLRGYYTRIPEYTPIMGDLKNQIYQLAFEISQETDVKKRRLLMEQYKDLQKTHAANLVIVAQMLSLAKTNRHLGRVKLLEFIRDGLFTSLLYSGDGKTLRSAYQAMTLEEETLLLAKLGVEVLHTKAVESGSTYYNTHSVLDRRTKVPFTIFVNISEPMRFLQKAKKRPF